MKNCKYCNNEFNPITTRGTEQDYCSKACRSKAGTERYKQKLINNGKAMEPGSQRINDETAIISNNNNEWERNIPNGHRTVISADIIGYMEENYRTKAELITVQLKHDQAIREIELLKQKVIALENEIEEEEYEPEQQQNIIGMLNELPEWITPAVGKILQSEKVLKYIESLIPEQQQ